MFKKKTYILENIYSDIHNFIDLLDINNDFYNFLRNPFLNSKKKYFFLYIISHIEYLSSTIIKFIIKKKKRGIISAFMRLWNKKKKWVQINVITAVPLRYSIEEYLLLFLKKSNNNIKFFFKKEVNNSIIGGLILRIEDKEWNNSLEDNIRKLRIHLKYYI